VPDVPDPGGLVYHLHNNFARECIFVTHSPRVAQEVVSALLKVTNTRPRVLVFALPQRLRFALGGLCGVTIDKVLVCTNQKRLQTMQENQQDKQDKKSKVVSLYGMKLVLTSWLLHKVMHARLLHFYNLYNFYNSAFATSCVAIFCMYG
jgi:hypothetical protein